MYTQSQGTCTYTETTTSKISKISLAVDAAGNYVGGSDWVSGKSFVVDRPTTGGRPAASLLRSVFLGQSLSAELALAALHTGVTPLTNVDATVQVRPSLFEL